MIKQMGIIGCYSEAEGFGKIKTEFGVEVLFYHTGVLNGADPKAGLAVSFEMHEALLVAINIQVIDQFGTAL
ncbi:hypothetical protein G7074_00235 [Pedobacter sp. HDW13]|uniref:hypothetical protein n=1 Tax=unclassified Pedobacter TaxID=2628915 RepID=UPI000F592920|nr:MULTISPECIES: hypothetical protein [unclassified Pedobacter]QIL37852.1 hypothetical protein G7074_00235 [Pedobacter sp. HDW13]RQO79091.1 hypothetical protein DBR40_05060 [Pedobacter sp. KBW01]